MFNATVKAELTGNVVEVFGEKRTPLKNAKVKLYPNCLDADDCMYEVEETTTDKEGKFTFKDVSKGVYFLSHEGKNIGTVTNCNFTSTKADVGEFEVKKPVCKWDIEVSGTSSSTFPTESYRYTGSAKWKNVYIEADPEVECHEELPMKNEGYYQLIYPKDPESVTGFINDDGLFTSLLRREQSVTTPFMFEFVHSNPFDGGATALGPMMNCGLWPAPGSVCSTPDLLMKLKNGEKFNFSINHVGMMGYYKENFRIKFSPSKEECDPFDDPDCDPFEEDEPPVCDDFDCDPDANGPGSDDGGTDDSDNGLPPGMGDSGSDGGVTVPGGGLDQVIDGIQNMFPSLFN